MRRHFSLVPVVVIAVLVFNLIPFQASANNIIPLPVLSEIRFVGADYLTRPLFLGLTARDTDVLVYINGRLAGTAEVNREGTATDNFYFQPAEPLPSGVHTVFAVAKDRATLVLSPPTTAQEFFIAPLPAPTLIQPNEDTVTGKVKHLITGLTVSGTKVHVYIDGVLNGRTEIVRHPSGTANFAYRPFLNLSVGTHTVYAIAEDETGRKSALSNAPRFRIEAPLPAPTIFEPVVNQDTNQRQPFIVGLAKNDTKIKIFIDHELDGEFKIENHPSGTASFTYRPFLPLTPGDHLLYVTAVDSRGKESVWSNIVYFPISRPSAPQITDEAAEDSADTVSRLPELIALAKLVRADRSVTISADELAALREVLKRKSELKISADDLRALEELLAGKTPEDKPIADRGTDLDDIRDLIDQGIATTALDSGLIDESRRPQDRLNLNLAIFILFLLAVIAWIFWVNRELIKERREKDRNKEE